jgi:prolyl 4-hydroxylase
MLTNCAPACQSCHMIDMAARCPEIPDQIPALKPGDLNKMFEKIVRDAPGNRTLTEVERQELQEKMIPEYTVNVLSRPSSSPSIEVDAILDKSLPPWVITIDDFLTPEECKTIIDLGQEAGFERSRDVGKKKYDGTYDGMESAGRTSENAWCSSAKGCRENEVIQRVMDRMGSIMGIPADNSEDLQILRYEKSQFYNPHHDYIPVSFDDMIKVFKIIMF